MNKYPTEYIKTRQQLTRNGNGAPKLSPIALLSRTLRENGIRHLYTGAGIFCLANTLKSAIRFLAFDIAKGMMPTNPNTGKVSPTGNMVAGMVAGMAESLTVVTPGETLKTKLVDDRAGPRAYRSTAHAIKAILSSEGPAGLYRGVFPVTLKQSANAMVRFTSYNYLLEFVRSVSNRSAVPAVAGALAGVVTVYATMPFDSIKTRVQAIGGDRMYQSSWHCARSVINAEGVRSLWKGTSPRLVRLSVSQKFCHPHLPSASHAETDHTQISGAISFSVYEYVIAWTSDLWSGKSEIRLAAII